MIALCGWVHSLRVRAAGSTATAMEGEKDTRARRKRMVRDRRGHDARKRERKGTIEKERWKITALTPRFSLSFFSFFSLSGNYVVKREAIKTQEIEQQSHLRGCRFATVYWSTMVAEGGGRGWWRGGKSEPVGWAKRKEKGKTQTRSSRTKRAVMFC